MKMKYTMPRFAIERELWTRFKMHCYDKDFDAEIALRTLVIRYLKHNKLVQGVVLDESGEELMKLVKKDRHSYYVGTWARKQKPEPKR